MGSGILLSLLEQVDQISATFVFNGYQNLVSAYSNAIIGIICLAVIVFGYAIINGMVTLSLADVSKRILSISIVLALALNWGNFSSYLYEVFTKVPNEISAKIVTAIPGAKFENQSGVNAALQEAFYEGMKFGSATWERAGTTNISAYLFAICIYSLIFFLVGLGLLELIAAKFGLAIYLVLAPLVIPLFLFQATRSAIFDGWFKHLVTFAFIPIFISAALSLGLMLMAFAAAYVQTDIKADILTLTTVSGYILSVIACSGLLWKATAMAASTASGFATEGAVYLKQAASSITPSNSKQKNDGSDGRNNYSFKGDNHNSFSKTNNDSPSSNN